MNFLPGHATISATIPATMCLCVGLDRKSRHEKLSHFLSGVFTEVVLSDIEKFTRNLLCKSLHTIGVVEKTAANLHTKILEFRGFD